VTEYAVPLLRFEIVNGLLGEPPPVIVLQLVPPLREYWYDVIGIPPLLTGAVQAIDAVVLPGVAVVRTGAEARATGVTVVEP
jgi:hypothetical protein